MNHYDNIFTKGTRLPVTLAKDYDRHDRSVLLFLFLLKNESISVSDFNDMGMTLPERTVKRVNNGKRFKLKYAGNGKWDVLKKEKVEIPDTKEKATRMRQDKYDPKRHQRLMDYVRNTDTIYVSDLLAMGYRDPKIALGGISTRNPDIRAFVKLDDKTYDIVRRKR